MKEFKKMAASSLSRASTQLQAGPSGAMDAHGTTGALDNVIESNPDQAPRNSATKSPNTTRPSTARIRRKAAKSSLHRWADQGCGVPAFFEASLLHEGRRSHASSWSAPVLWRFRPELGSTNHPPRPPTRLAKAPEDWSTPRTRVRSTRIGSPHLITT